MVRHDEPRARLPDQGYVKFQSQVKTGHPRMYSTGSRRGAAAASTGRAHRRLARAASPMTSSESSPFRRRRPAGGARRSGRGRRCDTRGSGGGAASLHARLDPARDGPNEPGVVPGGGELRRCETRHAERNHPFRDGTLAQIQVATHRADLLVRPTCAATQLFWEQRPPRRIAGLAQILRANPREQARPPQVDGIGRVLGGAAVIRKAGPAVASDGRREGAWQPYVGSRDLADPCPGDGLAASRRARCPRSRGRRSRRRRSLCRNLRTPSTPTVWTMPPSRAVRPMCCTTPPSILRGDAEMGAFDEGLGRTVRGRLLR